jgi:ubiquinone/menaquinone biosynthesis C-methylase UbiE
MKSYFDLVYNRIYDFTTAANAAYRRQQSECIDKLELSDNDSLLCIGVGTGNELERILERNNRLNIVAIDQSTTALSKACDKIRKLSGNVELKLMDARKLEFPPATFDKVLCIHVIDFIQEKEQALGEIFRVLKNGGRFVITYPARIEGPRLGLNLLVSNFKDITGPPLKRFFTAFEYAGRMLVGLLYLPLLLRPRKKAYSRAELERIHSELSNGGLNIEQDEEYQDFIVYGAKYT